MVRTYLIIGLLLALALAGCTSPIDEDTYELEAIGLVFSGTNAQFGLDATGPLSTFTDHIGGHYWTSAVDDPTAAFDDRAGNCAHVPGGGELPGTFQVDCDLKHFGPLAIYGHARATADDQVYNYWSEAQMVTVLPDDDTFALAIEDLEELEDGVSFTVNITGDLEGTSTHIGGHYWDAPTNNPTVAGSVGGCVHVAGGGTVPGSFQVTCSRTDSSSWQYRGHLRVEVDGQQWNYWSEEQTF